MDFRAQLTEARNWGADALALTSLYTEMGLIIKQAVTDLGWRPFIMGGDGVNPAIFEIAGDDAMEGSFWIQAMSYTDPKVIALDDLHEQEFGSRAVVPSNLVSAYDIMMFIADAITRAGVAEGPAIRDAMAVTENLEVTHFVWTVDRETNNPLNKPAAILRATDGQLQFVELWAPHD